MPPESWNEFVAPYSPFVVLGGFSDGAYDANKDVKAQPELFNLVELPNTGVDSLSQCTAIKALLLANYRGHLRLQAHKSFSIIAKEGKPSPLSPRNPISSIYPDKLLSIDWVHKYTKHMPVAVHLWFKLSNDQDQNDEETIEVIKRIYNVVGARGIAFTAVLASDGDFDATKRVAAIKRATALPAKCYFTVTDQVSAEGYAEELFQLAVSQQLDFYAARSREIRHKRNLLDGSTPLELARWEARYTFKLAAFSELKGDMQSTLRLYESAYDCVVQYLFPETTTERVSDGAWTNARTILDLTAAKIVYSALELKQPGTAAAKFNTHLEMGRALASVYGYEKSAQQLWQAAQYFWFGTMIDSSKYSDDSWGALLGPSNTAKTEFTALCRAGMAFLKCAQLCFDQPKSISHDPYITIELRPDVEDALANAVKDLNGPRSRASALLLMGEYKHQQNEHLEALQYYEAAAQLLRSVNSYYILKYCLAKVAELPNCGKGKVAAQIELLLFGVKSEFSGTEQVQVDQPLYKALGIFKPTAGFVGQKMECQIRLVPLSDVPRVDKCTVLLSNGESFIQTGSGDNLLAEHSFLPRSAGQISVESIELSCSIKGVTFTQKLLCEPTNKWCTLVDGVMKPQMLWVPQTRAEASVATRPALVEIDTTNLVSEACPGENVGFAIALKSREPEPANGSVNMQLLTDSDEVIEVHQQQFTLQPNETLDLVAETVELPIKGQHCQVKITVEYDTGDELLKAQQLSLHDIKLIKPLRSTFDLRPLIDTNEWPSPFYSLDRAIIRRWQLTASLLCLAPNIDIISCEFALLSPSADLKPLQCHTEMNKSLSHNESTKADCIFTAVKTAKAESRRLDASAELIIVWKRKGSKMPNMLKMPPIHLSLPSSEPRVLVTAERVGEYYHLVYTVENATQHILNFIVSIATSPSFAAQGLKNTKLRVLPYTRRRLEYKLVLVSQDTERILPDLRLFDAVYKRTLTVTPGNDSISSIPGSTQLLLAVE